MDSYTTSEAKTPAERKIADVTDPWFRNRMDAVIWLGNNKVKEGGRVAGCSMRRARPARAWRVEGLLQPPARGVTEPGPRPSVSHTTPPRHGKAIGGVREVGLRVVGRSVVGQNERGTGSEGAVLVVLVALSVSHLLNDTIQSLIAAVYPVLKESYALTFTQIGLITLAFQLTASLLQPLVGLYTDRRPQPFSLAIGMGVTLAGLLLLSVADNFPAILLAAALVGRRVGGVPPGGVPDGPAGVRRAARAGAVAVPGRRERRVGPRPAAGRVHRRARGARASLAWFSVAAVAAMLILFRVGLWYRAHLAERVAKKAGRRARRPCPRRRAAFAVGILLCLIFSKYFYLASLTQLLHAST